MADGRIFPTVLPFRQGYVIDVDRSVPSSELLSKMKQVTGDWVFAGTEGTVLWNVVEFE